MVCSRCSGRVCFVNGVCHAKRREAVQRMTWSLNDPQTRVETMFIVMHTSKGPGCKTLVQRTQECLHMACIQCKTGPAMTASKETPRQRNSAAPLLTPSVLELEVQHRDNAEEARGT
eukprot:3606539-Rhodomonas_salina.2